MTNLVRFIALHSYKGGTGKTILSLNLTEAFRKRGRNVCLFDFDFRAPSQHVWFDTTGAEYWLNDFLDGKCSIMQALINVQDNPTGSYGKLMVGLANPSTEAIRDINLKDRRWEMRALGRLLSVRNFLQDNGFDLLIIDASPGLLYSSINAVVSSDVALVAATPETSDLQGTIRMIHELYDLFSKKTALIFNRLIGVEILKIPGMKKDKSDGLLFNGLRVLAVVPCFCDVQRAGRGYVMVRERPNHPFTRIVEEMAASIDPQSRPAEKTQDAKLMQLYRDIFVKKTMGIHISDEER
ncbi:MAG: MinD/ParA family protein [Candidatus Bathyarchaeia archaeon]|jgi:septum site-determining protein MinD